MMTLYLHRTRGLVCLGQRVLNLLEQSPALRRIKHGCNPQQANDAVKGANQTLSARELKVLQVGLQNQNRNQRKPKNRHS
jgi:hypothetical protein